MRSNASFTKRSVSSRIACFDISRFLAFSGDFNGSGHAASFIVSSFRCNQYPSEFQPNPRHTMKPSKIQSIDPPFSRTTDAIARPRRRSRFRASAAEVIVFAADGPGAFHVFLLMRYCAQVERRHRCLPPPNTTKGSKRAIGWPVRRRPRRIALRDDQYSQLSRIPACTSSRER